jgi:hypothetical protein
MGGGIEAGFTSSPGWTVQAGVQLYLKDMNHAWPAIIEGDCFSRWRGIAMTDLLTPPFPLFSKTRKGGDLQMQSSCLTLKVTLFKADTGGFREGRGESVKPNCHFHIEPKFLDLNSQWRVGNS